MRRSTFILAALCSITLSACSSTQYKISLRDGRDYIAASEPRYVEKTGYYRYRDLRGKDALVRSDEVLFIRQM